VERAIVSFAAKVAESATSVTQGDIDGLRSLGLTDAEIFDVAATAAARCFLSKLMDATGTLPDGIYRQTIPDLVDDLAVGRPVAQVAT
jgi:alkylhydroperoxidase family enzyme